MTFVSEGCSTSCTSVVLANNRYYLNVRINLDALALLSRGWEPDWTAQSRYLHRMRTPTMPSFQVISSPAPLSGKLSRRLSGSLCKSASSASTQARPNDALSISLVIGASVSEPHTYGLAGAEMRNIVRQRGPGGLNSSRAAAPAGQYPLYHTRRARVAAPAGQP